MMINANPGYQEWLMRKAVQQAVIQLLPIEVW